MLFKILYSLYLIISLLYGKVLLFGPLSIRHIFTLLMLVMCFREGGLKFDRFLKWYMVFMLFFIVVEAGSGFSAHVFGKVFGTYLASIVLYLSTKVLIEKYEAEHVIIGILVSLGVVNAIEVIGQFFGNPIAQRLPEILHVSLEEEVFEIDDLHGYSVGGLMGTVTSGYFLSATSVLALYNKEGKISILNWLAFGIVFLGLFLVQERAGLVAGTLCAFLYFIFISVKEEKKVKMSALIFLVATIFASRYILQVISLGDMRYAAIGMSDNRRISIATEALDWILHNPIGGSSYFYSMGGYYPHNFFVNALLYGGIIGGLVLIGILFAQLIKIATIYISYYRKSAYTPLLLVTSSAYLCYTLNSFFHNYSLVLGGEMIFLLWAMVGSLKDIEDSDSDGENDEAEIEEIESGSITNE